VPLGAVRPAGGPVPRTLVVVRRRLQARRILVLLKSRSGVRAWLAGAHVGCWAAASHAHMSLYGSSACSFPPVRCQSRGATRLLLACGLSHARTRVKASASCFHTHVRHPPCSTGLQGQGRASGGGQPRRTVSADWAPLRMHADAGVGDAAGRHALHAHPARARGRPAQLRGRHGPGEPESRPSA